MKFAELAIPEDFVADEAPDIARALTIYGDLYEGMDPNSMYFAEEVLLATFPVGADASISVVRDNQNVIQAAAWLRFRPHRDADYLEGIAVDGPLRRTELRKGRGFGRFLMERLIEVSRTHGQSAIELRPMTDVAPFYERLGFHTIEQRPNIMRLDIPRP